MSWLDACHNAILWGNSLKADLIKSRNLGYLVLLASLATLVVGLILYLIDPNITSFHDGIWSAWVTMTHVGFGDVVPVSFFGRLLAAALILFGLVFFSIFTALVSVALIGKNFDGLAGGVRRLEAEASSLSGGEDKILAELAQLHKRMDVLQKQLLSNQDRSRPANSSSTRFQ